MTNAIFFKARIADKLQNQDMALVALRDGDIQDGGTDRRLRFRLARDGALWS